MAWAAWVNIVLGSLGAVAAYFSGLQAEHTAQQLGVSYEVIERHEDLGLTTALYWGLYMILAGVALRFRPKLAKRNSIHLVVQLGGLVLVVLTAHAGGTIVREMVYR